MILAMGARQNSVWFGLVWGRVSCSWGEPQTYLVELLILLSLPAEPSYLVNAVLGMEPRASCILGKHFTNWATCPDTMVPSFLFFFFLLLVSMGWNLGTCPCLTNILPLSYIPDLSSALLQTSLGTLNKSRGRAGSVASPIQQENGDSLRYFPPFKN